MPEALSDAQWAGIRELLEGEVPTHERVARASGVYVKTISLRAGRDGWRTLDFRFGRVRSAHRAMIELAAMARGGEELDPVDQPVEEPEIWMQEERGALPEPADGLSPQERLARTNGMLARRMETMLVRAEGGLPIETRQVAALNGMVQLSERIAALSETGVAQAQIDSDAELAGVLETVNNRIIHLARCFAGQILIENGMSEAEAERAVGGIVVLDDGDGEEGSPHSSVCRR